MNLNIDDAQMGSISAKLKPAARRRSRGYLPLRKDNSPYNDAMHQLDNDLSGFQSVSIRNDPIPYMHGHVALDRNPEDFEQDIWNEGHWKVAITALGMTA